MPNNLSYSQSCGNSQSSKDSDSESESWSITFGFQISNQLVAGLLGDTLVFEVERSSTTSESFTTTFIFFFRVTWCSETATFNCNPIYLLSTLWMEETFVFVSVWAHSTSLSVRASRVGLSRITFLGFSWASTWIASPTTSIYSNTHITPNQSIVEGLSSGCAVLDSIITFILDP